VGGRSEGGLGSTTYYRTIWLSDIHLGTRDCEARALLDFLDSHDCDYLYLVGDHRLLAPEAGSVLAPAAQ
jgi:hypothetical protein